MSDAEVVASLYGVGFTVAGFVAAYYVIYFRRNR